MAGKSKLIIPILVFAALVGLGKVLYAENLQVTARVVDTTISVNGYTEPDSLVTIENFGVALGTVVADSNGFFEEEFTPVDPGTYEISIYAEDSEGNLTNERTFTFTIVSRQVVELHNVILPPTVYPVNSSPAVGTPIEVRLLGKPNQTAYIVLQGSSSSNTYSLSTNNSGIAVFSINSSSLSEGEYSIYGYFEVAYPSDSFDFTLLPAPSATPTPTPSPPPTVTLTPRPRPTDLPGPTATPTPQRYSDISPSTTPAIVVEPVRKPGCTFSAEKLCSYDSNGDNKLQLDGEIETLISQFISQFGKSFPALDLNNNGRVDAQDLSTLVGNITYPESTITNLHSSLKEGVGFCNAGSISSGISQNIYSYFILLVFLNCILLLLLRLMRIKSAFQFGVLFLISVVFVLVVLLNTYRTYSSRITVMEGRNSSTVNTSQTGSLVTYNILLSSKQQQVNTVEVYLTFNPQELQVAEVDTSNSILPVIAQLGFSNDCGSILLIGGLAQPVGLFNERQLLQITFKKIGDGEIQQPTVSPNSKAYPLDQKKSAITPDVKIVEVVK